MSLNTFIDHEKYKYRLITVMICYECNKHGKQCCRVYRKLLSDCPNNEEIISY